LIFRTFSAVFQGWINDLKVGSNLRPNGGHIKASSSHVAFVHDSNCENKLFRDNVIILVSVGAGAVAVLPVDVCGRFSGFPLVAGHSGQVMDFDFSPFQSDLLATGADDCMVKLWNIPPARELESNLRLTQSAANLGPFDVRLSKFIQWNTCIVCRPESRISYFIHQLTT
jgi:WD40 repeat protein